MDLHPYRCRIIDADEARTTTHREVLEVMVQTFDTDGATILCEPSVVGGRGGPPDIAIVDPESGLHVVEVKGVKLEQVRSVHPGGAVEIAYGDRITRKDPSRQARNAMFDVKDAASRHFGGELNAAFEYWVAFPRIRRSEWEAKFGEAVSSRTDVLFAEDVESSSLGDRMRRSGRQRLRDVGPLPSLQLASLMAAFGDSAVLMPPERPPVAPPEGSLGERLAESYSDYRALTEQQKRLAASAWDDGPRLVRGVAGSGKTVVLATQLARQVWRRTRAEAGDGEPGMRRGELFASAVSAASAAPEMAVAPLLAVCFNRTLVPFIRDRIEVAYGERSGDRSGAAVSDESVEVLHFNSLMWSLSRHGLVRYQKVVPDADPGERARRYLADLETKTDRIVGGIYHAIFVDEGQDFHEDEYRVLLRLCGRTPAGQPRFFVFYDDAQNLYGRTRPTWADLGLEIRGRSVVMDEAFRSSRQIIEPAFNLLVGSYAPTPLRVGTTSFADLATLREKRLVEARGDHQVVGFAPREGDPVRTRYWAGAQAESAGVAARVHELLEDEALGPQDVLVLAFRRHRARELAEAIGRRLGGGRVRCTFDEGEKDRLAIQRDHVTVSTIASAKGYDAPHVLLASANDFGDDVEGRASFYVGCTRARDWLEVFACDTSPLVTEFERAVAGVE